MLNLHSIYNGHRLTPAIRMFADTEAFFCWRKVHGTGIVEEQERADRRSQVRIAKKCAHGKPVADPMAFCTTLDTTQLLD
jgi:hypothetical protein